MSAPSPVLEKSESTAALSRFFSNLAPLNGHGADPGTLHEANLAFLDGYKSYLLHPLSTVLVLACDKAGVWAPRTVEESSPTAYADLVFDTTNATKGVLGWQVKVRTLAQGSARIKTIQGNTATVKTFGRKLVDSTVGTTVGVQYTSMTEAYTAIQRFDMQGRPLDELLIQKGKQIASPQVMHAVIAHLADPAMLAPQVASMEQTRTKLAREIVDLLERGTEGGAAKQLVHTRKQYKSISFPPAHNAFRPYPQIAS